MSVGERIKRKREALGLTQQQLADKVGVARAAITQYEIGSKSPTVAVGVHIAKALDSTMDELFGDMN